jgi:hypothetical protein
MTTHPSLNKVELAMNRQSETLSALAMVLSWAMMIGLWVVVVVTVQFKLILGRYAFWNCFGQRVISLHAC